MPWESVYNSMGCNPIWKNDILGNTPSPREAVSMAAYVYGDKTDKILKGGWKVSTKDFGIKKSDPKSGFYSEVYQRTKKDGSIEYAYVTRGTELTSGKDWSNNLKQPFGLSEQYKQSTTNARRLANKMGSSQLSFVGHSLGGGMAAANALATGKKAITFNAAGLGYWTVYKPNPKATINSHILITDPLNRMQNKTLSVMGQLMPDVDGNVHNLLPKDFSSFYNGHSMDNVLKCFNIDPVKYDKFVPSGSTTPTTVFSKIPSFAPSFNF